MTDLDISKSPPEEYESPIWDSPPKYICPNPDLILDQTDYDGFIRSLSYHMRRRGQINIENIRVECHGQCPDGCKEKFKMKLGKSVTKKKYEKIYNHGKSNPKHCIYINYEGVINHGV